MMPALDLIGRTFGQWTVLERRAPLQKGRQVIAAPARFARQSNERKAKMSDELKNSTTLAGTAFPESPRNRGAALRATAFADDLDGYTDAVEGIERSAGLGLIKGSHLKFSTAGDWETPEGEMFDRDTKLLAQGFTRAVVKWPIGKGPPEETRIIPRGQPFPDIEAMNEAIPTTEWRQGLNGLQGPWQVQQAVVLVDPRDMSFYTFVTSAVGGFIAIRELADKVRAMRHWRGPVSPIVTLGDMPMKTRFGERRRPHFCVVDWVRMSGSEPQQSALPAPKQISTDEVIAGEVESRREPVTIEAAGNPDQDYLEVAPVKAAVKAKPKRKSKSFTLGESIAPLTTAEEMGDEIPF